MIPVNKQFILLDMMLDTMNAPKEVQEAFHIRAINYITYLVDMYGDEETGILYEACRIKIIGMILKEELSCQN